MADELLVALGIEGVEAGGDGRARPDEERGVEGELGDLQVALELGAGDVERFAHRIETVGTTVLGKAREDIEIEAEEVVEGVLVFAAIEAAEKRAAVRGVLRGELRAERGEEGSHRGGGGAGFFGGWHLAGGDTVEDAHPFLVRRSLGAVEG